MPPKVNPQKICEGCGIWLGKYPHLFCTATCENKTKLEWDRWVSAQYWPWIQRRQESKRAEREQEALASEEKRKTDAAATEIIRSIKLPPTEARESPAYEPPESGKLPAVQNYGDDT